MIMVVLLRLLKFRNGSMMRVSIFLLILSNFYLVEAQAQSPSTTADGKCRYPLATWAIKSEAMLPGILPGKVLTSICLAHAMAGIQSSPDSLELAASNYILQPGDILVTKWPRHPENAPVVKRLIGMAGDRVKFVNSLLYINDVEVRRTNEPNWNSTLRAQQVSLIRWKETLPNGKSYDIVFQVPADESPLENTQEFLVPSKNLFVVGDNRDDSIDGRLPSYFGFVPYSDVEAVLIKDNPELQGIAERLAPSIVKQIAPWWPGTMLIE